MSRFGIKEVFDTLQGEGARAGCRSVFVRFTGCNLWDGNPLHRDTGHGACAKWCDTDFAKGKVTDVDALLEQMDVAWPKSEAIVGAQCNYRWCVLTGGEPMLQVNKGFIRTIRGAGWLVAVETNGTIENEALDLCDHVCVSPKLGSRLMVTKAHELKVILPGAVMGSEGWTDEALEALEKSGTWGRLYVQPQDPLLSPTEVEVTLLRRSSAAVPDEVVDIGGHLFALSVTRCQEFIQKHSHWMLSQQTHKTLGLR